ncbi:TetR/AcrR family transcriptional regulator [Nonomuraea sp. MCN248]|uniref:TetR/AcrR family transcriptional regulator n=1 Tax=Nonomuraea corallina TaxID=2989783 RepID=A0ABT4SEE8_9ACTN|nr:TetR/AcrR family transcriptional regulator [Nonomuraea corallina]MDA0635345.1 TetR/AcrR family transcriptional regulator [Nonomuraea corallina]
MDPQQSGARPDGGRTARKRRAILAAATEVFLQNGYLGASMDEVAAKAAVSKQTVYKQFADKKHLFAEIILGTTAHLVDGFEQTYGSILDEATDPRQALRDLARDFLANLTRPDVLQLRRLVIAEADRFPDISGAWFERGFHQSLVLLGQALERLADRGLLRKPADPTLAAYQFAGLVMYKPMNQLMFAGAQAGPDPKELDHIADQAAEAFLAAYG